MDTMETILERRSIRNFTDQALTEEEIKTLSDAALASPSAMNNQPWLFSFVLNRQIIATLSESAISFFAEQGSAATVERIKSRHESLFYGAPLVVIVTLPKEVASDIDVGIAVQNMALAAQSMGLGSCIIGLAAGSFAGGREQKNFELLKIPEGRRFAMSIAIGHPAMTKEAHDLHPEKVAYLR